MNSIAQSWPWILIALAAIAFFLYRSRHQGRDAMASGDHHHGADGEDTRTVSTSPVVPDAAIDPVSGAPIRTAGAPSSVYQGRIYYFASKENRERFEVSAAEFASKAPGFAIASSRTSERPRRRRGGC